MITQRLRPLGPVVAVCSLLTATNLGVAQTTLNVNEMRAAAAKSLSVGQPQQAAALAQALLTRNSEDLVALLIQARALRDLGQMAPALQSSKTAWQLSKTDTDRYAAAMITAQVLSSDDKKTRAQLWLRRAAQNAPNDALKARAARDFRYVRQNNPWHTSLSFTLAPNSNINNGSARDSSELNYKISEILFGEPLEFALSGSARALSGLEYGFGVTSRYRAYQTETTAHDINFGLSYRSFLLSDGSKKDAPGVSGDDFAFGTASIGYGYQQINMDRRGEFSFDADLGQTWYGGARYASFGRFSLGQSWRPSPTQKLQLAFSAERQIGQRTTDVDTFRVSTSLNQRLGSGDLAYFKFGLAKTLSDNQDSEYGEVELRFGYVLAKPVLGADVQLGVSTAFRDYDVSMHHIDGREDFRVSADVTATFKQIDYYGFNPSVTITAAKTNSNIGLYDVNRFGVSLGIRSAF